MSASQRRRVVQRGVSLQPEHDAALLHIADDDGHRNVSRAVQDLIEREMRGRLGKDWRLHLGPVEIGPVELEAVGD